MLHNEVSLGGSTPEGNDQSSCYVTAICDGSHSDHEAQQFCVTPNSSVRYHSFARTDEKVTPVHRRTGRHKREQGSRTNTPMRGATQDSLLCAVCEDSPNFKSVPFNQDGAADGRKCHSHSEVATAPHRAPGEIECPHKSAINCDAYPKRKNTSASNVSVHVHSHLVQSGASLKKHCQYTIVVMVVNCILAVLCTAVTCKRGAANDCGAGIEGTLDGQCRQTLLVALMIAACVTWALALVLFIIAILKVKIKCAFAQFSLIFVFACAESVAFGVTLYQKGVYQGASAYTAGLMWIEVGAPVQVALALGVAVSQVFLFKNYTKLDRVRTILQKDEVRVEDEGVYAFDLHRSQQQMPLLQVSHDVTRGVSRSVSRGVSRVSETKQQ